MPTARDLSDHLAELLRREHGALADFLLALVDFDRTRLWVELGHASLFSYLHVELRLSKGAAHYRKTAAELLQRVPGVIEPLRDGRLCFSTIVELSKVLTPENQAEVLPRFFHTSKLEAKAISAVLRPVETVPRRDLVTAVRGPAFSVAPAHAVAQASMDAAKQASSVKAPESIQASLAMVGPSLAGLADSGRGRAISVHPDELGHANSADPMRVELAPVSAARAAAPRDVIEPMTAALRRMHVTVSKRFAEKLEAARAALSHSHPGASAEEILEAGLDLLLARHAERRGMVAKPRKVPRPAKPGHIPAHVKAAVWRRDGGRCQWKLESGGICGSTHRVEIDHVVAKALGGPPTIDGLRCLCRVHNDLAARETFGDAWMDRFTRGSARGLRDHRASAATAPRPT